MILSTSISYLTLCVDADQTTVISIHTDQPNIDIPPTESLTSTTVPPSTGKPLPSYRPAFKVLELFREPWPYKEHPPELDGSREWNTIPSTSLDPDDLMKQ